MDFVRIGARLAACMAVVTICGATISTTTERTELKRVDLSGAPGMEVITSISEFKAGEELPRHIHHGIETGYVLQGSMVQYAGKAPVMMETGTAIMNLRDVPHAGFKVVGQQPLKLRGGSGFSDTGTSNGMDAPARHGISCARVAVLRNHSNRQERPR